MYVYSEDALMMVAGYSFNAWGKFDSFKQAAHFVYGEEWAENGNIFVHWGPNGTLITADRFYTFPDYLSLSTRRASRAPFRDSCDSSYASPG